MSDFSTFSEQLRQRFEALSQHELYTVANLSEAELEAKIRALS